MSILIVLILAIGLSMDAFSLALIYGTLGLKKAIEKSTSIIVGIFHFFMPIIGFKVGTIVLKIIRINPDYIVGIIFIILGLEMLFSIKKEERVKILTNLFSIIIFAFTVSIDSFSTGIALGASNTNILIPCIIFSVVSGTFTFMGLTLGKKVSNTFGHISVVIGSLILIILGIKYLI